MSGLPEMLYADGIGKARQVKFGGYDHRLQAGDGDIWDMQNMRSDLYPLLSPRRPRHLLRTLTKPNGLYAKDGLFWVDGTGFFEDGKQRGTVADSAKRFASLGAYIVILPDKACYNTETGEFGSLEASWSGEAVIQDGSYAGEAAAANTILAAGTDWDSIFSVGDAVEISGATAHPENNQTIIVREIEGDELRFYENSFVIGSGGDDEKLTLARKVPDIEYICENENRLWGCKGDTIYSSKLGDPFNWNVFDGLSTDSYAVNVGSAGDFTACVSYLGYPCFFKEEHIYKVYGDKPSNFQVMGSASLGVEKGSGGSPAIAGEVLFYLARTGIVSYSGGIPQSVAAPFGTVRYKNAVGGSDGTKYYVSMEDAEGAHTLFVYDTRVNLWHKEDDTEALAFGWARELYFLDSGGGLWLSGDARDVPSESEMETEVQSKVEFADFTEDDPNKKGTSKLQLRVELEAGARLGISMQFDSDGLWRPVAALETAKKRSYYLPIIPRRSDHFRIKLEGTGDWRLYSLVRESYSGSEM